MSRRRVVLLTVALSLGACGGGGDAEAPAPPAPADPAAPGAGVDPNADGVVGGSINRAKDVADDAESRGAQLDQQP